MKLPDQILVMTGVEDSQHAAMLFEALKTEVAGMQSYDLYRESGRYCDDEYFKRAEAMKHLVELAYGKLPDVGGDT
jgi:hypothetical protein